ncbi:MAG: hypothetical protein GXO48_07385 [Chlorobi bacterium]|nr:hypothetical protein [Chlorobiota bacterium]
MSIRLIVLGILLYAMFLSMAFAQTCPFVEKILINACGLGGQEGYNEYVLINTGGSGMDINQLELCFPTQGIGCYCNNGCGTQTFVSNQAYINTLNASAGCAQPLFVDAVSNNPLPPNALLLVFTGNPPTYNYNFSNHCGQGPIYVLFANNTTSGTGRFGNGKRCRGRNRFQTFSASFGPSCSQNITYDRCNFVNQNGESIIVNPDGTLTYGVLDGCTVLPEEIHILLTMELMDESVALKWRFQGDSNAIVMQRLMIRHLDRHIDTLHIDNDATEHVISTNNLESHLLIWVEAIDETGNVIRSNHVAIEPENNKEEIYISFVPHPLLILKKPYQPIDITVYSIDGTLIWTSEGTPVEEANERLKKLYYKLEAGAYVLHVNSIYAKLFFK